MSGVVDVFDILRPVLSQEKSMVHLAPLDWPERRDITTLCGRAINGAPTSATFAKSGCPACARRAVEAGITAVRERPRLVVNLTRFIDDHPSPPQREGRPFQARRRSGST